MRILCLVLLGLLPSMASADVACGARLAALTLGFQLKQQTAAVELVGLRAVLEREAATISARVAADQSLDRKDGWTCVDATLAEYPARRCARTLKGGGELVARIGAKDHSKRSTGIELHLSKTDSRSEDRVQYQALASLVPAAAGWERRTSSYAALYLDLDSFVLASSEATQGFSDLGRYLRQVAPECYVHATAASVSGMASKATPSLQPAAPATVKSVPAQ